MALEFDKPADWSEVRLSEVADIRFSNVDKKTNLGELPALLCNYMDVYSNDYIRLGLDFMQATVSPAEKTRFAVERGDVIATKDSETPDDIGVPAVVMDDIPDLVCGYHLAQIKPHTEVDSVFLSKQIAHERVARYFGRLANGSTRYGLSTSSFENLPVWLPSLDHQRKIARILMTLDNVIAKTEALIAKYQAIKQGMMHDLFTRGVDSSGQLRPTQEQAPELYKQSEIGWIPKEWDEFPLTEVASYQSGNAFPSTDYCDEGIPLLRPGNMPVHEFVEFDDGHTTCLPWHWESQAREYLVAGGELVMNLTAQSLEDQFLGRVCMTRPGTHCLLNQRIARFRTKSCDLRFLFWWFKGPQFRREIDRITQGTKVQHIYNSNLNSMNVAVPKTENEQRRIAEILFSVAQRKHGEESRLAKLADQKMGLMQDLLTGKVRVNVDEAEEVAAHA